MYAFRIIQKGFMILYAFSAFYLRKNRSRFVMLEVMLHISISTSVIAAMDSTTTTARGTMTGSWRPFTEICLLPPSFVMVDCSLEIEGVGLTDTRKKMSLPSLMPPRIPPEWLVSLMIFPSGSLVYWSLFV